MIDTKQKILETAERLFAENGYDATSLRQIIAEAGVNLAAIHYHFGSKQEMLDELIERKAGPVNDQRIARLDRVVAQAKSGPLAVEQVLDAFMEPMASVANQNPQFVRLIGRMHAEGLMPVLIKRHFQPVIVRFRAAMQQALPELSEEELLWRLHFMMGAMAHAMCGTPDFTDVGRESGDFHDRIARLVAFLSGGFHAPLPVGVQNRGELDETRMDIDAIGSVVSDGGGSVGGPRTAPVEPQARGRDRDFRGR
jgi:AcrR family transcriptional regulator